MQVDPRLCTGCGRCISVCAAGAIRLERGDGERRAVVDPDLCVECGVCLRLGICAAKALVPTALQWPRTLRSIFSDPLTEFQETQVTGRGTEEMKTNDVTGRFGAGEVGFGVEMGRPGTGCRFADVEVVTRELARAGVTFEPKNPVTFLMTDTSTGEIRPEVLGEKVLTAIIEFKVPAHRAEEILKLLTSLGERLQTVFSLDFIVRAEPDGEPEVVERLRRAGWWLSPNGKVCLGLGRPGGEGGGRR